MFRERLHEDRERLKEAWARGEYALNPSLDAKVRGQCEVMSQFLDLNLEDIEKD